jgi:hypothetical protein
MTIVELLLAGGADGEATRGVSDAAAASEDPLTPVADIPSAVERVADSGMLLAEEFLSRVTGTVVVEAPPLTTPTTDPIVEETPPPCAGTVEVAPPMAPTADPIVEETPPPCALPLPPPVEGGVELVVVVAVPAGDCTVVCATFVVDCTRCWAPAPTDVATAVACVADATCCVTVCVVFAAPVAVCVAV